MLLFGHVSRSFTGVVFLSSFYFLFSNYSGNSSQRYSYRCIRTDRIAWPLQASRSALTFSLSSLKLFSKGVWTFRINLFCILIPYAFSLWWLTTQSNLSQLLKVSGPKHYHMHLICPSYPGPLGSSSRMNSEAFKRGNICNGIRRGSGISLTSEISRLMWSGCKGCHARG